MSDDQTRHEEFPVGTEEDQQWILEMLIAHARSRLEARLQDSDELSTRALGVLALDASAIALLVALRNDLHHLWWLAGLGFGISAGFLLATVWPRSFDTGPDPVAFYATFGGTTRLEASRHMLSELANALETTVPIMALKSRLFRWGFRLLILALVSFVAVALAK